MGSYLKNTFMLLLILLPWYMLYTCLILTRTCIRNWLSIWTILELRSWIIIILTLNDKRHEILFKIYIVFSISSIILVLLWLWAPRQEEWILCLLAFKMGIPPLHWWIGWVIKHIKWITMWWFTTFHKIIPILISFLLIDTILILWWGILSLLWRRARFWFTSSYFIIFFYSSCIHTSWLWITIYRLYSFLLYFSFYTLIIYFIFHSIKYDQPWVCNYKFMIIIIIMLGVPTSIVFFIKLITARFYLNFTTLLIWCLLLVNIITILPYTRITWSSISNTFISCNNSCPQNTANICFFTLWIQFSLWPLIL